MKDQTIMNRWKVYRYWVPACVALILIGGCSQSRATLSRQDASTSSRAMPDIDSALGATDSLGSHIFSEVRPRLSQAEMVYRMASADDPNLQRQSFYSPDVRLTLVPRQVIVSGEGVETVLETATSETAMADRLE